MYGSVLLPRPEKEKRISITLYRDMFLVITRCLSCYNKLFSRFNVIRLAFSGVAAAVVM